MIPKFRAYSVEENVMYYPDEDKNVEWTIDDDTGFIAPLINLGNGTWETFEACEIVYDGDYAQFCFKNDASNFLSYYRNLCIIGNIHENPELLEDK